MRGRRKACRKVGEKSSRVCSTAHRGPGAVRSHCGPWSLGAANASPWRHRINASGATHENDQTRRPRQMSALMNKAVNELDQAGERMAGDLRSMINDGEDLLRASAKISD